jgi:hypothetical protein
MNVDLDFIDRIFQNSANATRDASNNHIDFLSIHVYFLIFVGKSVEGVICSCNPIIMLTMESRMVKKN